MLLHADICKYFLRIPLNKLRALKYVYEDYFSFHNNAIMQIPAVSYLSRSNENAKVLTQILRFILSS